MDSARTITDSKALAAMAHPLRRRILDALLVDGPATASMLAERTGQAVGNASHHLRVLAAAALVEEAPELARDRRERWWRRGEDRLRWSSTTFDESDAATAAIVDAALSLGLEHQVAKVREWNARREGEPAEWDQAAFSTDTWLRLTPAELGELSAELVAVFARWRERQDVDDGQAREPVFVFARGVPAAP